MVTTGSTIPPELLARRPSGLGRRLVTIGIALAILAAAVWGIVAMGHLARSATDRSFVLEGQAAQLARSGLVSAINWMRVQPEQPVHVLRPTVADSIDPERGFVRECWITENVWGRFEVGRIVEHGSLDVSRQRGHARSGQVWKLRATGYVFERDHEARPFEQSKVLHATTLEVEVDRLAIRLPGRGALCVRSAGDVLLGRRARLAGGNSAAGLCSADTVPRAFLLGAENRITGSVATASLAAGEKGDVDRFSLRSVFGVDRPVLVAMADHHVREASYFPEDLATGTLTVADVEHLDLTEARPLRGHGVVVVRGNLTLGPGSVNGFRGLLFVDGDLVIRSEGELTGAVVVTGSTSLRPASGTLTVRYDGDLLRDLPSELGHYRISTPVRVVPAKPAFSIR